MFAHNKPIIGMVHLLPLPGSARFAGSMPDIIERAVSDAETLEHGGVDGIMVENFFDAPFCSSAVPPITVAAMTAGILAIREALSLPIGVNVLRNDVRSAISIAHVVDARFVRCNVYVGAAITDQGIIEGAAREAVMLRAELGADLEIWADVDVKHASALGGRSIAEMASDAVERGLADALIITGSATGQEASAESLRDVKAAVPNTRVLVGSGVNSANIAGLLNVADGAIVGSSLKRDADIKSPVDLAKVQALVSAIPRNSKHS